ncbi:MAG: VOC family protein [Gammaproteobacteria bacterium]|nr:VOC family protein [Gammaproteobacteria bacterium]MDH5802226.1 VOC family protein [Gammaproteobacteria bacterium]
MNRPTHFELTAEDPEKLAGFYSQVFGWQISKWEGPVDYWLVSTGNDADKGINGAIMGRNNVQQPVVNTIEVSSLDETFATVTSNGGNKVTEPMEIPGVGTFAYCVDPGGTLFGILQPA